ncbi:hypothetical protein TIFTF001_002414 [Ficus carica]|uniref:Uncharacterized protein n=1 Tax=Ficus carica TaxID=3494 RepID=A0AA87ZU21_FICCA|nr:hypothetical protein TIFTF001_002414 [Ficus carica]
MGQPGGWGSNFELPNMLRRGLETVTAAGDYLSLGQIVTVVLATHVGGLWCCYLLLAYVRTPRPISNSNEFRRFLSSIPEFPIWCSAAMVLKVAIVVTFFMPRGEVILAVGCYIIGLYVWIAYLNLRSSRSLRAQAADENERLLDVELGASSSRKQN